LKNRENDSAILLEKKFNEFSSEFSTLLQDYKRKSKRLDRIIKLSDKQQFDMIKLNEQLDQYKNHLENLVDEKTKELQELNKNLEQRVQEEVEANRKKDQHLHDQAKFAQLGELIGNIAHQWRQPLNAISTTVSGMQAMRELGIYEQEEEDEALKIIFERTQYLSGVINNFRDFIDQKHEQENISLQDLIQSTADIIKSSLENDIINLNLDLPSEDIELLTIPSDLSNVLLTLIKNSKDALSKLDATDEKIITITLEQKENQIDIIVADNAKGIGVDILPKIFDPYFTTKHQSQGTGLGLYLARKTMEEKLNGTLEVLETSHKGTKFIISIKQV